MASLDDGATFAEHDTTAFLPASQGRPVDLTDSALSAGVQSAVGYGGARAADALTPRVGREEEYGGRSERSDRDRGPRRDRPRGEMR